MMFKKDLKVPFILSKFSASEYVSVEVVAVVEEVFHGNMNKWIPKVHSGCRSCGGCGGGFSWQHK